MPRLTNANWAVGLLAATRKAPLFVTVPGLLLPRRAFRRAVRAEYTTIVGLGPEHRVARGALVEVQARIGGHRLRLPVSAERAGDGRLEDHRRGESGSSF